MKEKLLNSYILSTVLLTIYWIQLGDGCIYKLIMFVKRCLGYRPQGMSEMSTIIILKCGQYYKSVTLSGH